MSTSSVFAAFVVLVEVDDLDSLACAAATTVSNVNAQDTAMIRVQLRSMEVVSFVSILTLLREMPMSAAQRDANICRRDVGQQRSLAMDLGSGLGEPKLKLACGRYPSWFPRRVADAVRQEGH